MATRVFSDEELAQLRGFPKITRDELIRFFTLTSANRALWTLAVGVRREIALGWPCSCARCRGWLSRADRHNTLAAALKEYGALRRTIYAARYLARPDYRRKIGRQLNKGESMHALRRDVFYAHEGAIRRRHMQHQNDQAWYVTLAANAITAWTTEYLRLAVQQLRSQGRLVDDTLLAHLSPAQSETIGLIGTITVDIDHELAQLDPHRPPRPSQAFRRDTSAMSGLMNRRAHQ